MTEKLIGRYLSVKKLAEGGLAGERTTAKKILESMERKNPGIKEAAQRHESYAKMREEAPSPFPSYSPGNFDYIFRQAYGFYTTVKGVVEEVSNALHGRELAQDIDFSGNRRGQDLFIRIKVPLRIVKESRGLNDIQKEFFRQALHEEFDVFIDDILGE